MDGPETLRVVFTGQSGLGKRNILSRFCKYVCTRQQLKENFVRCYHAEDHLGVSMTSFLRLGWRDQHRRWKRSIRSALREWENERPPYAFLSLHLSYQWRSRFFSPLSWRDVVEAEESETIRPSLLYYIGEKFQPDYYVTLIDDIQAVQQRVAPTLQQHLRLRELLTWRGFEVFLTDLLAQDTVLRSQPDRDHLDFPFERSPVVAVRHPPEMLYRLLFEPQRPRIYASFPISRTRDTHQGEINRFREALHRVFTVFDPVTIDERPLQSLLQGYRAEYLAKQPELTDPSSVPLLGVRRTLAAADRWYIPPESTLCDEAPRDTELALDEIQEIAVARPAAKIEIDRTIVARDFRLIDQADCVVVYRSLFGEGRPSRGTKEEMQYAAEREPPKAVFLIHNPAAIEAGGDGGPFIPDTFGLEFIEDEDLFQFANLSQPANQDEALKGVVARLEEKAAELTANRLGHRPKS